MRHPLHKTILSVSTAAAMSLTSLASPAQSNLLEEIIVTAQKREQSLQEVPIAVTAIGNLELRDRGIRKIEDLPKLVPSIIMVELALSQNLGMRGVFSGENQGFEQSVGTYVDGVYRGRPLQARHPFLDVERVEALRGPQSLLFGKNSVAGALNIISAKPTEEFAADITASYSEFENGQDEKELIGVISGPLGDNVRGRLAARYLNSEGFMENSFLGEGEPSFEETQLRGVLEIDVTENLVATLKAEHATFDRKGFISETADEVPAAGGPFAGLTYAEILVALGQPVEILDNTQNFKNHSSGDSSDNEANEYVLTLNQQIGEHTLTSITAFSEYEYTDLLDSDFTAASVILLTSEEEFEQFSQEIRWTSPLYDRFNYIVGAYYDKSDFTFDDAIVVPLDSILAFLLEADIPGAGAAIAGTATPRTLEQDAETMAAFFQGTWNFSDRFRINGGLRYTYEEKDASRELNITTLDGEVPPGTPLTQILYSALFNINEHSLSDDRSDSNVLPTVVLEYDWNDDTLTYASWRKGTKSGGFDARSNNPPELGGTFDFDQEENDTFEIGLKTTIAGAAQLNLAAYYSNYKDMQVSVFDGVLGFNVQNAAEATIMGFELDGLWAVTSNLDLNASLALTDFEWDEYAGPCPVGRTPDAADGVNCDFEGSGNQFVPEWNGNIGFNYTRPVWTDYEIGVRANLYFSDEYFAAGNHDPSQIQDSYEELDATISFGPTDGQWRIAVIGKNLTDEAVVADAADTPLAASIFGAPSYLNLMKKPRSIVIQLSAAF